jgi:hypothetical protein
MPRGLVDAALRELACDGAWTRLQAVSRLAELGDPDISPYVTVSVARLRRTACARRTVPVEVLRLNARGEEEARRLGGRVQAIRRGELEHALGLAELRWRCGALSSLYAPQDELGRAHRSSVARGGTGLMERLPDGLFATAGGYILCEYDHGRYTGAQVREKIAAARSVTEVGGLPVLGLVWGVPTEGRARWLRQRGARHVVVLDPRTWLG